MTKSKHSLVIAAGGTGGHMFPAQSLAEIMLARGWTVTLSTDARGALYTQAFPDAVPVEQVASATFARGGALAKLAVPFKIGVGILEAVWRFARNRPSIVVGFGGYPSIPAIAAAWILRIPRAIHEQNAVLGRVNQAVARRVDAVACSIQGTELPQGVKGVHTGNPVRAAVAERAAAPYTLTNNGPLNIVVVGGSQGARILSDVVPEAIAALPDSLKPRVHMVQQARPEDIDRVRAFYAEHGISAEVESFIHDLPDRLVTAHLVICRSGASTVADVCAIGRPSLLIPYAHAARGEQHANAAGLSQAGAGVVIEESHLNPGVLSSHIAAILGDPQKASAMAGAATKIGRPDAVLRLADLVEKLAMGQQV